MVQGSGMEETFVDSFMDSKLAQVAFDHGSIVVTVSVAWMLVENHQPIAPTPTVVTHATRRTTAAALPREDAGG